MGGPLYTIDTNDSLIAPVSSEQTEAAKTPTETPSSSTKTNSHNVRKIRLSNVALRVEHMRAEESYVTRPISHTLYVYCLSSTGLQTCSIN